MKNICFAYFVNDKFVGWYGDTFGTISKLPKIYPNSARQIERIKKNFQYKMEKLFTNLHENAISEHPTVKLIQTLLFSTAEKDKELLGEDINEVVLKTITCDVYDGPNPDFDKKDYDLWLADKKALGSDDTSKYPGEPQYIYASRDDVVMWVDTILNNLEFAGFINISNYQVYKHNLETIKE